MTQNEKMAIVQNICSSATSGTDCKGLSLKEQATELMKGYGIPTTASILEIPLYWNNQVSILFTVDGVKECVYELALGNSVSDGEFFEILCVSESGKELPLDYFANKHLAKSKIRVEFSNGTIFEFSKLTNGIFKLILCELECATKSGENAQAYIINAITGQIKFIIGATDYGFGNIVYTISRPYHMNECSIVRNTTHQ